MKVALCLSGQYRTFDSGIVQKSLKHFILDRYDCDVYFSTWKNRGISLNHGNRIEYKREIDEITPQYILTYIPNAVVDIENYDDWKLSLSREYTEVANSLAGSLYSGMLPQLYKKWRVNSIVGKSYDWVINTRPDLAYFSSPEIEKCIDIPNTVWNINPPGKMGYYPNRIYDIFMMGSQKSMSIMSTCFFNVFNLFDDPFGSNLGWADCCKMLHIHAKKFNNLEVNSVSDIIADTYRGNDLNEFFNHYKNGVDISNLQKVL